MIISLPQTTCKPTHQTHPAANDEHHPHTAPSPPQPTVVMVRLARWGPRGSMELCARIRTGLAIGCCSGSSTGTLVRRSRLWTRLAAAGNAAPPVGGGARNRSRVNRNPVSSERCSWFPILYIDVEYVHSSRRAASPRASRSSHTPPLMSAVVTCSASLESSLAQRVLAQAALQASASTRRSICKRQESVADGYVCAIDGWPLHDICEIRPHPSEQVKSHRISYGFVMGRCGTGREMGQNYVCGGGRHVHVC
ncbi:hypothetical protein L226DRAFT_302717 [Lentinus tigrinus ALCF2SS1-7]|uniref:Uncharacterized protein n=1 Tax=Lentinus tigrinus ALCF2SS1-6 TaxID=1328759 RepID=A0A5C2S2I3_9APHY|nr:hypothetical protein L227DRAFT_227648 [Lentinus tigrinus ALCF2SS1-6]RPD78823.1 hypothetical protein L226DRAFT_302717 [Lentinus tigrinus ALCF2SS1-7]